MMTFLIVQLLHREGLLLLQQTCVVPVDEALA